MRKIGIILAAIILIVVGIVLFKKDALAPTNSPTVAGEGQPLSDEEVQELVEQVSRHIQVPSETPTVGIVTDIETLSATQPFYLGAKNGDILLIYPSISRAILFDPDKDLIINVGPVVFENPEGGPGTIE